MKKLLFTLMLLGCGARMLTAQGLDLQWSEQFPYDNKIDGFFDYFISSNEKYVYAKFSNLARNPRKVNKKIKLIAFDEISMKRAGEVKLLGYGKDKKKKDLEYHQTVVLDNMIYVIWVKESKSKVEIFAENYDNKLKKANSLKKVYEISRTKKATDNLFILYNKELDNKILVGKEFAISSENESLRFEYKLLNEDFSVASSGQVNLPIKVTEKPRRDNSYNNLVCSYEFGDDGKIYAKKKVRLDEAERKGLRKRESAVYTVFMQINPETGDVKEQSIRFPSKNTFNLSSIITKNGIRLYGFFSDLEKDVKGNDTHGIFYLSFDNETFSQQSKKFSYFSKKFLDDLYASDQENQKKGKGLFKSKKAKESDSESIDDNYVIEKVIEEGDDILLFCSIMKNWTQRVCHTNNGSTTCYTKYYCTKNNVTAFRLDKEGNIKWSSNMDRAITYDGWDIYDLSVIKKNSEYYVVYGSAYQVNAKKKSRRYAKSKQQYADRFDYAVFNSVDGQYTRNEYQVNKMGTKSRDKKYVSETAIRTMDNKMYTECRKTKYKGIVWLGCLVPPSLYILMNSPNMRHGKGYMGVISTK